MNLKLAWNRRSFLAALGTLSGGLLAPPEWNATSTFGKKHKPTVPALDGRPIVPITTGLGSTGDIYAELGVTPLVNINGTLYRHRWLGDGARGHGVDAERKRALCSDRRA